LRNYTKRHWVITYDVSVLACKGRTSTLSIDPLWFLVILKWSESYNSCTSSNQITFWRKTNVFRNVISTKIRVFLLFKKKLLNFKLHFPYCFITLSPIFRSALYIIMVFMRDAFKFDKIIETYERLRLAIVVDQVVFIRNYYKKNSFKICKKNTTSTL